MNTNREKGRLLCVTAVASLLLCAGSGFAANVGGTVMPPTSRPHGWTLDAMTSQVAFFNASGNNPAYYPSTPFQVLYVREWTGVDDTWTCKNGQAGLHFTGVSTFEVPSGSAFFVPVWNTDDSPPVLGTFPTDKSGAAAYFFGPAAYGVSGRVIVDGKPADLGPSYIGGPVTTAPLPDGGGTHFMTLGAFIPPLNVGTHTVRITGQIGNSQAFMDTYGSPCWDADFTYTVTVLPSL